MTNIMDHNSKVDFINQCSRDLEKKLASENQKLHHWLHHDANHNQNGNHSQNGNHYQSQTASVIDLKLKPAWSRVLTL